MLLSHKVDGTNMLEKTTGTGSNININLKSCFCPSTECLSNIDILQLSFGFCQHLKEMYLDVKQ